MLPTSQLTNGSVPWDTRLDGIDKRIDALASDWRLSLDVHERLAALEARLEKR